jgi:hypothetical protein
MIYEEAWLLHCKNLGFLKTIPLGIGTIGSMVECLGGEFGVKGAVVFIAPANPLIGNLPFQWNFYRGSSC